MLLAEYVLRGLLAGTVYGLLAMPMSLMFMTLGTVDFALGSYTLLAAAIAANVGGLAGIAYGVGGALVASALMAGVFVALRRLGQHEAIAVALAGFGLSVAIGSIVLASWGASAFVREGVDGVVALAGIRLNVQALLNAGIGLALLVGLSFLLFRTPLGLSLRASAINAAGAELAGIAVLRTQSAMFIAGGLIAGIVGILILYSSGLDFTAGLALTLAGFAAAIVFGMTSPWRAFAGGLLIGVAEVLSAGYVSSAFAALVPQLVVLLALSLRAWRSGRFAGVRP